MQARRNRWRDDDVERRTGKHVSTIIVCLKGLGAAAMLAVSRGLAVRPGSTTAARRRARFRRFSKTVAVFSGALFYALAGTQAGHCALVLDDALLGSTTGTRSGGAFVAGGWQVTGKTDTICWHVPTITRGAAEFDVRGLQPNERRAGMEDKTELFHMYDHTVGDADSNYTGGYRDNPFKHFIRKIGSLDAPKVDAMEVVWQIQPNCEEPDTPRLAWDSDTTYHFREEWGPNGPGKSTLKLYRDGVLLLAASVPGPWKPAGHSVRIAASPRRDPAAGAPVGAIFSRVKVWDLSSGTNLVRLKGHSLGDDSGPFLGLGASYFQALRHAKYDRARLKSNLALFAAKGFNYVRIFSMVSWDGLEIAPVSFTNRAGRVVTAWPDYWQQFRDLLDLVAQHGLRAELTLFADAQYVMPAKPVRQAHLDGILANLAGREPQILHLEVANEAWQNGFPGAQGIADLRAFTRHLADRTSVPVAITSNDDTSDQGIVSLYRGSAADLATVHFSRDTRTVEGGWLPVRDAYRAGQLPGVPPVSSNEPIGPGSSVGSENDPIKLCAAAVFAYLANLPAYVYHSRAGVYGYVRCCPPAGGEARFEDTAGINAYQFLRQILPPDLASWVRNDGLEPSAPFTAFCNGQPNRYWPGVSRPTDGCDRNIGSSRGAEFVCFPMGILAGGVTLEARRPVQFQVFNPLSGEVVSNLTLNAGNRFTLPPGPGACILKGTFLPRPRRAAQVQETGAGMQPTAPVGQPIPPWLSKAPPLPPPQGEVIRVATVDELLAAVDRVGPGGTILLADGQYKLPRVIVLQRKKQSHRQL
jgi:hypothetical protein